MDALLDWVRDNSWLAAFLTAVLTGVTTALITLRRAAISVIAAPTERDLLERRCKQLERAMKMADSLGDQAMADLEDCRKQLRTASRAGNDS